VTATCRAFETPAAAAPAESAALPLNNSQPPRLLYPRLRRPPSFLLRHK